MAGSARTATPLPARIGRTRAKSYAEMLGSRADGEETRLRGLLQKAFDGKLNCTLEVTLDVSPATSTTITEPLITEDSVLLLMPKTATAAAEVLALYVVPSFGSAVVNHSASVASDRTYGVAIIG